MGLLHRHLDRVRKSAGKLQPRLALLVSTFVLLLDCRSTLNIPRYGSVRFRISRRLKQCCCERYSVGAVGHAAGLRSFQGDLERIHSHLHHVRRNNAAEIIGAYGLQRVQVATCIAVCRQRQGCSRTTTVGHCKASCSTYPAEVGKLRIGERNGKAQYLGTRTVDQRRHHDLASVFFAVFQDNLIVPVHQPVARVCELVINAIGRGQLLIQRHAELVIHGHFCRGFGLTALALAMINAQADHWHRAVRHAQGDGTWIFLAIARAEQSYLVTEILLVDRFTDDLWKRRQAALDAQVITIRWALKVILQIRRHFPVRQPMIEVAAETNVIREHLGAQAQAIVLTRHVAVIEGVDTGNPVVDVPAVAGAGVEGIAIALSVRIRSTETELSKHQIPVRIVDGQQHVEATGLTAFAACIE